jgi:hypothetical protein
MKNIQPIAIAAVVLVVIAAILIIGITISQQALAATNLNSSKSNIYRVHQEQEQSVNADTINGPVTQTSTISCDCSQSDTTTINNSEG